MSSKPVDDFGAGAGAWRGAAAGRGAEKYTTEIIADNLQLLGGREGGGGGGDEGGGGGGGYAPRERSAPAPRPAAAPRQAPAPAPKSSTGFDDMDDDIPF